MPTEIISILAIEQALKVSLRELNCTCMVLLKGMCIWFFLQITKNFTEVQKSLIRGGGLDPQVSRKRGFAWDQNILGSRKANTISRIYGQGIRRHFTSKRALRENFSLKLSTRTKNMEQIPTYFSTKFDKIHVFFALFPEIKS